MCTYRGADVGSDHNLVIGNIKMKLKKAKAAAPKKPYATGNLKDAETSRRFYIDAKNRFAALQHATDHKEQWNIFSQAIAECRNNTG